MSAKKKSGGTAAIGVKLFIAPPKRRRPGRHKKRVKPANQTFFPTQKLRQKCR